MDDDVPVLIAGGSLVGLSTALFLGRTASRSLVVERHPGTAIHPRAALFNQRTIEIYRSVGLEDEIVEASEREFVQNGAIVSVESARRQGARVLLPQHQRGRRGPEPVAAALHHADRARADPAAGAPSELGARLEYGTELVSFEQDDDGVTALVSERATAASERTVRARYLVARRRQPQPGPRERLGIPTARARQLLEQHHDLLPRRRPPLLGDRNLSVDLRLRPAAAGLLPLLEGRRRGLPRRQHDARRATATLTTRRLGAGHERGAVRRATCARRSARRTCRSRSRTSSAGTRAPTGRSASGRAASSSPATRPT